MILVDIEQDIYFMYYDDKKQCFEKKFGTVKEFLQTFADYESLYVYTLNFESIKKYEEQKKREN